MSFELSMDPLLLSSAAKAQQRKAVYAQVQQALENNLSTISADLGKTPLRFDLTGDSHTSRSDPQPHYLVDAYHMDDDGNELPLGAIHVYEDGRTTNFNTPRAKVVQAYKNATGNSFPP